MWRADGRELFYLNSGRLMAVPVETEGAFRHDTAVELFDLPDLARVNWSDQIFDVSRDGRRFLFLTAQEDDAIENSAATLLQGWRRLLEK